MSPPEDPGGKTSHRSNRENSMQKIRLWLCLLLLPAGCAQETTLTVVPETSKHTVTSTPPGTASPTAAPTATATATATTPSGGAPDAGDARIRISDGMTLRYVPAGDFTMGSADTDAQADQLEKPQHVAHLDAFWIDQTEVTNTQYKICVEAGGCQAPTTCDFGEVAYNDAARMDHPVACVTWHDAQAYCQWTGGRLPTEAQWEKAARGTDGRLYPWGNTIDCSRGNFDDERVVDDYVVPAGEGCDGYPQTAPVGAFPSGASPYGALDMAGNVWEWVSDWSDWEYYARSPYKNPTGPGTGDQKELRGGSFHYGLSYMRAATRHSAPPEHRADALGFRCVTPEEQMTE
jgi:formylglycine-generating enzyme required for sulfatase activity